MKETNSKGPGNDQRLYRILAHQGDVPGELFLDEVHIRLAAAIQSPAMIEPWDAEPWQCAVSVYKRCPVAGLKTPEFSERGRALQMISIWPDVLCPVPMIKTTFGTKIPTSED